MGNQVLIPSVLGRILIGIFVALTLGVLASSNASAMGRTTAYNSIEQTRKNACLNQTPNIFGAVWINDTPQSSTGMDRWDEGIVVPYNATTVTVTMWTTAFACSDLAGSVNDAQIINLREATGSPVDILSFSATSIYRGDATRGTFTDASPGTAGEQIGSIRITINVSGRGTAGGGQVCYPDAVHYRGEYRDADRGGLETTYREDLCITRLGQPWDTHGTSVVSDTTAVPGQSIRWDHYVGNYGPATATNVYWSTHNYDPVAGTRSLALNSGGPISLVNDENRNVRDNFYLVPANAPNGQRFCQQIAYRPAWYNGSSYGGTAFSTPTCTTVTYDYNLVPSVSGGAATGVEPGSNVSFTFNMGNRAAGGYTATTISEARTWRIRQLTIAPGATVSHPYMTNEFTDGLSGGCANYNAVPGWSCREDSPTMNNTSTGVNTAGIAPNGIRQLGTYTYTVGNLAPGTRVCYLVTVSPPTENDSTPQFRNGRPHCIVVGRKPYTVIKNGDAWAGGSYRAVDANCSMAGAQSGGFLGDTSAYTTPVPSSYGSFGEYQLFGLNTITDFGSAGRPLYNALTYKGPSPQGSLYAAAAPLTAASNLTSRCMDDVLDNVNLGGASALGATANPASMNGIHTKTDTGLLTIDTGGAAMTSGRHVVIHAAGDILINSNITFAPGPYANLGDIPSLILISRGTIRISQNVTQLDGIYQAYGQFITCNESVSGPIGENSNVCDQKLTVNGAVSANDFVLRRVIGNGPSAAERNTPAEEFVFRPDILLSAYGQGQGNGVLRTVSERELPPRY